MDNYGTTTHRPSPNPLSLPAGEGSEDPAQKSAGHTFAFSCPFDIPSSPDSAAERIVRNLERFALYYALFVWTVLFIALAPERQLSVVYLVATTEVGFLYVLLQRALSDWVVLDRVIDRRFVFFLLFVITCLEMILTNASKHLFIVLAATVPVVMAHAALMSRSWPEDVAVRRDGEMARLVQEKLGEAESLV